MAIEQLTSRDNPLLKTIRLIASGARRAPANLIVAEGVRVLGEMDACGCDVEAVVLSEGFGVAGKEKNLLESWLAKSTRVCRVSESLYKSISDVQAPQGALALVRYPERSFDDIPPAANALVVLACGIQDPGNLGSLIRAAAAAGASLLCTEKRTVSVRNPKAVRASAGALFRIPIVERADPEEFLAYCGRNSIRAYRTDVLHGEPHTNVDLRSACAILLGNEGSGLAWREYPGLPAIRIPMASDVESLNVATAGAILLFEALRQRSLA